MRALPSFPAFARSGPAGVRGGFTLVEMLVVIAVISVLIALVTPAFKGFTDAQGVSQGVHGVASFLELARDEARTRQTYVWVAFNGTTDGSTSILQMGAVYSKDGSASTTSANLSPLGTTVTVRNVAFRPWAELKAGTAALFQGTPAPKDVCNNASGVSFTVGKVAYPPAGGQGTFGTLTFTPEGTALLAGTGITATTGYDLNADVVIRQARGTVVAANADDAAVVIDGATGRARILQLGTSATY